MASTTERAAHSESSDNMGTGHPRGTLAIMAIYALLFVAGWLVLYVFTYTPRGPVLP